MVQIYLDVEIGDSRLDETWKYKIRRVRKPFVAVNPKIHSKTLNSVTFKSRLHLARDSRSNGLELL